MTKRWEDNIREWTDLSIYESQRALQDRKDLGGMHLWCPNDRTWVMGQEARRERMKNLISDEKQHS
ncbi:Uncharacterized protein DAT39_005686, partial [Clarias magur]